MTQLSLSGKSLSSGTVAVLVPALTRLQALDLSGCGIGGTAVSRSSEVAAPEGASAAGEASAEAAAMAALAGTGVLTSLALRGNPLGPAFCRQLASGIGAAVCLRRLDLAGTGMGPEGCAALALQLQPAAATEALHLDVSGCSIGDDGLQAVCGAAVRGAPLAALLAGGAALSAGGLAAALRPLADPPGVTVVLRELDLSGSHDCIDDSSAAALGEVTLRRSLSWDRIAPIEPTRCFRSSCRVCTPLAQAVSCLCALGQLRQYIFWSIGRDCPVGSLPDGWMHQAFSVRPQAPCPACRSCLCSTQPWAAVASAAWFSAWENPQ